MPTSEPFRTPEGYSLEVRSDLIWMTVYDRCGKPAGTLERPHRGTKRWHMYHLDGSEVAGILKNRTGFIGPRTALHMLVHEIRKAGRL